MIYLKWKLSDGKFGTNPIEAISNLGVSASTGAYVDAEGYRIGYLSESVDITQLDSKWDIEEVTESEALAFCQNIWFIREWFEFKLRSPNRLLNRYCRDEMKIRLKGRRY